MEHKNNTFNVLTTIASELLGLVVPFSGILSTYLIKKTSHSFGLSSFQSLLEMDTKGITLEKERVIIDLDEFQSTKELLWYQPPILKEYPLIAKMLDVDKIKLGDLFKLQNIKVDRTGIYLKTYLSEGSNQVLQTITGMLSGNSLQVPWWKRVIGNKT